MSTLPVSSTGGKAAIAGASVGVGVLSAVAGVAVKYYSDKFKEKHCVESSSAPAQPDVPQPPHVPAPLPGPQPQPSAQPAPPPPGPHQ